MRSVSLMCVALVAGTWLEATKHRCLKALAWTTCQGKAFQDRYLSQRDKSLSNTALSFLMEMFYRNHPSDLISFSLNFI